MCIARSAVTRLPPHMAKIITHIQMDLCRSNGVQPHDAKFMDRPIDQRDDGAAQNHTSVRVAECLA